MKNQRHIDDSELEQLLFGAAPYVEKLLSEQVPPKAKIKPSPSIVKHLRIAACALLAVGLSAVPLQNNSEALREKNLQLDYEADASMSPIYYEGSEEAKFVLIDNVKLGYIPDGFELIEEDLSKMSCTYIYQNDTNKMFYFDVEQIWVGGTIDTEDSSVEYITINGSKALYMQKYTANRHNTLVWQDGYRSYQLFGFGIAKDELFKIAENVTI